MVNDATPKTFYSLTLIQALAKQGHLTVANLRASNRLQELGWGSDCLIDFILALNDRHFVAQYPQCTCGSRNIDCDGYKMQFNEEKRVENMEDGIVIFTKLALSGYNKTLIISFHLDGSPG